MATPLLSAALIVKNEADNLPGCLESLRTLGPLLHEICIYDTGSTDDTVAIARAAGAKVVEGYWDDDFSRARNEAIGMCSGRWVFIIDADEQVIAEPSALRRRLRGTRESVDALAVSHLSRSQGRPLEMLSLRVLRRSRTHYIHKVHEQPTRRDGRAPSSVQLPTDEFRMVHGGYADEARTRDKLRRNLALADRQVNGLREAADSDPHALMKALVDRARTAATLGDLDAATTDFEEIRTQHEASQYRTYGLEVYAINLLDRALWDRAERVLRELVQDGASDPQLLAFLHARLAYGLDDPATALDLVREVNVITDSAYIAYQTTLAIELRMVAAAKMGETEESLACCLQLILHHHKVASYGNLLVGLWGTRPVEMLVEVLAEVPADFVGSVIAELEHAKGWGPAAAQLLRARVINAPAAV